jgi:GntR family transcriptional regulator
VGEPDVPAQPPAYRRIVDDIRQQIASGALAPGDVLPSEAELREMYGVSNTVVRNAVLILKAERLVEGRQGSGVYVAAPQPTA